MVCLCQISAVVYLDEQGVSLPDQPQLRASALAGMSEDIGQAFLHNPVRGQVDARVQVAWCAFDLMGELLADCWK